VIRIFAALAYLSRMRKVTFDRVSRRAEPKFLPGPHDGYRLIVQREGKRVRR